jgi:hypothetical protein
MGFFLCPTQWVGFKIRAQPDPTDTLALIIQSQNNRKATKKAEMQLSSKELLPQKAKSKVATTSKATPKGMILRTI